MSPTKLRDAVSRIELWTTVSALAGCLCLVGCGGSSDAAVDPSLIHVVGYGDLPVTVRERGDIQAAEDTRVKSKLEGRATLIHLVPEGLMVEKGDLLARLDVSEIESKRATEAIGVARAEAALEQARKNNEIVESELLAAEKTAESRLEIATMRREKFLGQPRRPDAVEAEGRGAVGTNAEMLQKLEELLTSNKKANPAGAAKFADLADKVRELLGRSGDLALEMGEMANQILQQIDEINLARADLEMAADTLFHSRNLQEKNFITRNELERDIISHKRQLSKVTVAWNNLQLLIKYTLRETLITLDQEIENARLTLISVKGTNDARRVREAAELKSANSEFLLAKEKLENLEQQVANAEMRAPTPGMVVYGRYDWDEQVYEGMSVRQGQDIVVLPDIRQMVARLKVHEAQIDQVAIGQPARVKADAFPGRVLRGKVDHIATMPQPTRRSTDLKMYMVRVMLDQSMADVGLRPGMNATVEIDVGVYRNVLNVPVPCVKRRGESHYVWMIEDGRPQAHRVKIGRNNLTHVEILDGLEAGDVVMMVPPDGAETPDENPAAESGAGEGAAADGKAGVGPAAAQQAPAPGTGAGQSQESQGEVGSDN
ncbi:MAG: efflux RND transporter periplasmic adaptor subunit [Planctomycetota bacterium]|nr:efflux RND transporter periplasmic adaptor subunit [Planctomycetota bacterium]